MQSKNFYIYFVILISLKPLTANNQNKEIYEIKNRIYNTESIVKAQVTSVNDTISENNTQKTKEIRPPIKFSNRPFTIGVGIGFSTLGTDEINELLYNIYAIRLTENGVDQIPKFEGELSNSLNFISKISFDPIRLFSIGLIGKICWSYDDTDDALSSMKEQDATLYNFSGGFTIALKKGAYKNVYPRLGGSFLKTYSTLKITSLIGNTKLSGNASEGQIFTGVGIEFSRLRVTLDFGVNFGKVPYSLESTSLETDFPYDYNRTLNLFGFNFEATANFKLGRSN